MGVIRCFDTLAGIQILIIDIPHYDISVKPNTHFYQFISSGPKGKILKGIQFSKVQHDPLIYNLALGDIDSITNKLDDKIIADNKDRDIILATVGHVALHFCKRVVGAGIIAVGNSKAKKRLYQIKVASNLIEIQKSFTIYGLVKKEGLWEIFVKNRQYQALLILPI